MFLNAWRDRVSENPFHLLAARVLTVVYALWKLFSYKWSTLQEWPLFVFRSGGESFLVPAPLIVDLLRIEVAITSVLLVAVLVGYRLRTTALASAVLFAHLSGVHHTVTNQAITFLPLVYLLLLWALFSHRDVVTVDELRRTGKRSLASLNEFLSGATPTAYPHPQLRWFLFVVALTYFFTGYGKILSSGLPWATPVNLGRLIQLEVLMHLGYPPVAGMILVTNDWVGGLAAIGTVVLELGFIIAVLTGWLFAPFVIGLLGMHTGIAIWMHVFFFDQYILFALFLPWGAAFTRLADDTPLTVLYDDRCYFCARSLYLIKHLDVHDAITFHTPDSIPSDRLARDKVDPGRAMYAFQGGKTYEGYWAFHRIVRQFGALAPIAWIMALRPIARVGERVYRYVAANRSQFGTCGIEDL